MDEVHLEMRIGKLDEETREFFLDCESHNNLQNHEKVDF